MRWWVFILLPFHLLAQETYDNCVGIPVQHYQVDYDADKEYYWYISGPGTNGIFAQVTGDVNALSVYWPDSVGTYIISVATIRFGCLGDTSYHEVIVEECDYAQLFFPSSFTPNGDNHNEVYQIKGQAASEIEYMSIYNRWGQRIVESDKNIAWDGKNCQPGVYLVNIFVRNNRYIRTITLIR